MRLFEIDEASIYAKDDEKFRPFIELGQKILNSTEIGSGVDWKGKDDLWNKASIVGGALTRLGNGTGSPQEALEKAGIKSQAEWQEIMSLADQAEKADFDAGDDDEVEEDMNAILASAGKKKHGDKYMDAARKKAQDKGAPLSSKERNDLRDKHSKNRKDKK